MRFPRIIAGSSLGARDEGKEKNMPCVNSDGTLSETARMLLKIIERSPDLAEIAKRSGKPVFLVRLNLRELVKAGLVTEKGEQYFIEDSAKGKF